MVPAALLARPPEKDAPFAFEAELRLAGNLLAFGLVCRILYAARAAWRRRMQLGGAVPLAMSEEDAEEEEERAISGKGKAGGRAVVDLNHLSNDDDFPA